MDYMDEVDFAPPSLMSDASSSFITIREEVEEDDPGDVHTDESFEYDRGRSLTMDHHVNDDTAPFLFSQSAAKQGMIEVMKQYNRQKYESSDCCRGGGRRICVWTGRRLLFTCMIWLAVALSVVAANITLSFMQREWIHALKSAECTYRSCALLGESLPSECCCDINVLANETIVFEARLCSSWDVTRSECAKYYHQRVLSCWYSDDKSIWFRRPDVWIIKMIACMVIVAIGAVANVAMFVCVKPFGGRVVEGGGKGRRMYHDYM